MCVAHERADKKQKLLTTAQDDLRKTLNATAKRTDRAKGGRLLVIDSGCSTSLLTNKDEIKNYQSCNIKINVAND